MYGIVVLPQKKGLIFLCLFREGGWIYTAINRGCR